MHYHSLSYNRLVYNPATNDYSNTPGVDIRVPGFGDTITVATTATDGSTAGTFPYMNKLINYFVSQGYVSGTTIRAAPYDWRLSAGLLNECTHAFCNSVFSILLLMMLYYSCSPTKATWLLLTAAVTSGDYAQ